MEIQDKHLVQGQGINNAYHLHQLQHPQQPAFNNSSTNNSFHSNNNPSRFDPNLNNVAASSTSVAPNSFENIILVGTGTDSTSLLLDDASNSRYLINSFADRTQGPPPSYESLVHHQQQSQTQLHHQPGDYQSNTNDFILQDTTGNQIIFHRNDSVDVQNSQNRLYPQAASLLDDTDDNSAELESDMQAMIDNYARNYETSSFEDSKNEIIINQFDILGGTNDEQSQGINLLIEQNAGVGYLMDQHSRQASEEDADGIVLDRERLLLENTMSPLLAAVTQAETQLANTSLNGIDLFNTIPDETTIPTVVESLNARIEESCNPKIDPNLNIKREEKELVIENSFVPCRAYASLPTQYLYLNKNPETGDFEVYTKKSIPTNTKFGPFEGVLRNFLPDQMEVLKKAGAEDTKLFFINESHILDLTDENMSNWMRYVSFAKSPSEKNLELVQCDDEQLFFKSCRLIRQNERLVYGIGFEYAQRFGLTEEISRPVQSKRPPLLRMSAIKEVDMHLLDADDILTGLEDDEDEDETQEDLRTAFIKTEPKSFESEETSNDKENTLFRCRPCQKVFVDGERLEKHNETVHANDPSIEGLEKSEVCPRCRKRFELKSSLNEHMKIHESIDARQNDQKLSVRTLTCPFCDIKLSQVALPEHVRQHCVDGWFSCPHCDKKVKKYRLIRRHIRDYHPDIEHPCDQCEKSFKTMKKLQFHLTKHSTKKEFLCSDCGKMLKRKDKLNEHIRRFHSEDKTDFDEEIPATIKVEEQPKNTSNKGKPRLTRKRTKDDESTEDVANDDSKQVSTTTDKIEKKRRIMTKSPNNDDYERFIYKCHDCRLGFKRRGMLVNHLYKRHPDIPIDSVPELNLPILKEQKCYYCQFCDKVYKSSSKRKAHILKYHPDSIDVNEVRSYRNPAFSETVGSIKTEPQACPWCYKQYASKTKLIQHQRIKHPEQMKETGNCWTSQSSVESTSSPNHLTVPGQTQRTKGLQELQTYSSFESEKEFYDVDYITAASSGCSQQQQQQQQQQRLCPQNSIELHQVPQSVLDPNVVRLTELTINQHELIDLATAVTSTKSGISHLFDDMDFMQLKTVELHCLDDAAVSSSTVLHHNGG
ncbi:uncharacterized protein LOC134830650 [Culicoides brevitarsis]|uniref:uncharacterized protein LOC134830650 n=1 Tax=Culicoides brevitarsis TaxID=469753 RepID=UPI00307B3467